MVEHQVIKVGPASESERAVKRARAVPDSGPVRVQLWFNHTFVHATPIRFNDQGHPDDLYWTPTELVRFNTLVFVWGSRVFRKRLGYTVHVPAGQQLHLALGHLKLADKFGRDVLKAGRS